MSPSSDYTSAPSSGRLKLKGVKDSKVDKKRSKKKKHHTEENASGEDKQKASDLNDKSVALRSLEDEDAVMTKEKHREVAMVDGKEVAPGSGVEDESLGERIKTDAEKRYDEQRRKRVSFNILLQYEHG